MPQHFGEFWGHPKPKKVFLRNQPSDELVSDSYVGVEVECSMSRRFTRGSSQHWTSVSDGSLRNGGYEHRFREPLWGLDVVEALEELEVKLGGGDARFDAHCSTHIHVDVRDMSPPDAMSFILYWVIFEKVLFTNFAPDRMDNNFCVPLFKTDAVLKELRGSYRDLLLGHTPYLPEHRYLALNIWSASQHGSFETRIWNGTAMKEDLLLYINSVLSLKRTAMEETVDEFKWKPYIKSKGRALQDFLFEVFGEDLGEKLMYVGIWDDIKFGIEQARKITNHHDVEVHCLYQKLTDQQQPDIVEDMMAGDWLSGIDLDNLDRIANNLDRIANRFVQTQDGDSE